MKPLEQKSDEVYRTVVLKSPRKLKTLNLNGEIMDSSSKI